MVLVVVLKDITTLIAYIYSNAQMPYKHKNANELT